MADDGTKEDCMETLSENDDDFSSVFDDEDLSGTLSNPPKKKKRKFSFNFTKAELYNAFVQAYDEFSHEGITSVYRKACTFLGRGSTNKTRMMFYNAIQRAELDDSIKEYIRLEQNQSSAGESSNQATTTDCLENFDPENTDLLEISDENIDSQTEKMEHCEFIDISWIQDTQKKGKDYIRVLCKPLALFLFTRDQEVFVRKKGKSCLHIIKSETVVQDLICATLHSHVGSCSGRPAEYYVGVIANMKIPAFEFICAQKNQLGLETFLMTYLGKFDHNSPFNVLVLDVDITLIHIAMKVFNMTNLLEYTKYCFSMQWKKLNKPIPIYICCMGFVNSVWKMMESYEIAEEQKQILSVIFTLMAITTKQEDFDAIFEHLIYLTCSRTHNEKTDSPNHEALMEQVHQFTKSARNRKFEAIAEDFDYFEEHYYESPFYQKYYGKFLQILPIINGLEGSGEENEFYSSGFMEAAIRKYMSFCNLWSKAFCCTGEDVIKNNGCAMKNRVAINFVESVKSRCKISEPTKLRDFLQMRQNQMKTDIQRFC
ncbi:hypothetical protein DMENIID0001_055940 [Sergentomyia squamirostris]